MASSERLGARHCADAETENDGCGDDVAEETGHHAPPTGKPRAGVESLARTIVGSRNDGGLAGGPSRPGRAMATSQRDARAV